MAKASADTFVVDASTLLVLVLDDTAERKQYTEAMIDAAEKGRVRLVIPQFCHVELAVNLMRPQRSTGRTLTSAEVGSFLDTIEGLSIATVVETYSARGICDLARKIKSQVADSVYLMLAKSMGAGIASLDNGMRQGARNLKLSLFEPVPVDR